MERKLISYAMECASYIIGNVKGIDAIILHGSIARGDNDKESDIDLFIHTTDKKIEGKVKESIEKYYKTQIYKNWLLKGIKNAFSIIVGDIESDEWKNLHRAIMNTGIILYGKYKALPEKVNQYVLISFENIKPDAKRVSLYRSIFGFTVKKEKYAGLMEKWRAKKIGKGTLLIPLEHAQKAQQFFKERKIGVTVYDFWSDAVE